MIGAVVLESAVAAGAVESQPTVTLAPGFRDVYQQHFDLVWRSLRRLGVEASCLDDAVQDVFLVVHRRLPSFRGRSTLTTWVYGIVLRVAKDYRRSATRRANRLAQLTRIELLDLDQSGCPAGAAERREANRLLLSVLESLPDRLREVLVLVDVEELSIREAASASGIGLRTAQRRLKGARLAFDAALVRQLGKEGR